MTGRVSSYELLESFLVSGPSTFFRARSAVLGNLVILRRVTLDPTRADDARATFFREMRHAAGLQIPGMVRILDAFEADGALWSVQENRIGTQSEKIVLDRGPVPLVDAARWGGEIADLLAHLHSRGFVSGRVAPRWVLVDEQGAVLAAWTKSADLAAGLWPLRPAVAAWSAFTAPEELAGAKTSPEADLYSLAATIVWWLTGQYPAGGSTPEEALERARAGAGEAPTAARCAGRARDPRLDPRARLARDPPSARQRRPLGTVLQETRLGCSPRCPRASRGAHLPLGAGEAIGARRGATGPARSGSSSARAPCPRAARSRSRRSSPSTARTRRPASASSASPRRSRASTTRT
jgi:serine/threonine protein kinase